jgi:hypothetical protein
MSELTKEHFDQTIKGLASRDELHKAVAPLATRQDVREGVEELARMVSTGFEDIQARLDVREQMKTFERKFERLEEALHIKL